MIFFDMSPEEEFEVPHSPLEDKLAEMEQKKRAMDMEFHKVKPMRSRINFDMIVDDIILHGPRVFAR